MKSDVIQYERAYNLLKTRIECGILPVGAKLPGRADLSRELGTSQRTIRRALELLAEDGNLEIAPRKRPAVISAFATEQGRALKNTKKADAARVNDLIQTASLLCDPIYRRGLRLCTGGNWDTPQAIFAEMDPARPQEFWQLSSRLWRFFIARNENELMLRAVDLLGFRGKEPPHGSLTERTRYLSRIDTLFRTVKSGREPGKAELGAIFSQYRAIAEQAGQMQFLQVCSPCPMLAQADGMAQQLTLAQERYSTVSLDLLGLIAMGRYRPGDRLPTHDQLQTLYGVSRDTTVKAIAMLRRWGVVTAAPRRGISVVMDLESLQKIQIAPDSIACHVRRYLDTLELLALTAENVASHAGGQAQPEDARRLDKALRWQLQQPCTHQLIPRMLLDFVSEHIRYDALRAIYKTLARNLSVGRGIPKLVSRERDAINGAIYAYCIEAADALAEGDAHRFARIAAGMFKQVRDLVAAACKELGYWDAAMRVYDGAALWQ